MCKTGSVAQAAITWSDLSLHVTETSLIPVVLEPESSTLKGNFILAWFYFFTLALIKFQFCLTSNQNLCGMKCTRKCTELQQRL